MKKIPRSRSSIRCISDALVALLLLLWLTAGMLGAVAATPVDESEPYGRACVGVISGEFEAPLQVDSKPNHSSYITVHAEANARCRILAFAFNARDGKLANDWRPQFFEVPAWGEVLLPEPLSAWRWSENSEPFEFHVLFVHPNSRAGRRLEKLIKAMGDPHSGSALFSQQATRLREMSTGLAIDPGKVVNLAPTGTVEIGATYRGSEFPWRKYSSAVNFSEEKAGLLIFHKNESDSARGDSGRR